MMAHPHIFHCGQMDLLILGRININYSQNKHSFGFR